MVRGRCGVIKHVEIGVHADGPFKGLQFFKVTIEKAVNVERATETVAKIVGAMNLIQAGMVKKK